MSEEGREVRERLAEAGGEVEVGEGSREVVDGLAELVPEF